MKFRSHTFDRLRDAYQNRQEPENMRTLSNLYWRSTLLLAVLIVFLILVWGLANLSQILADLGTTPYTTPLPAPALNRTTLEATISRFESRQVQFDALKSRSPTATPDPSR